MKKLKSNSKKKKIKKDRNKRAPNQKTNAAMITSAKIYTKKKPKKPPKNRQTEP